MAMDESTRKYRAHEFADLGRSMATGFKLKVTAEHSEESRATKWLNVSAEELEAIIKLLIGKEVSTPANPWDLTRSAPGLYAEWQEEVSNGDTLRGFADWLYAQEEG